MYSTELFTRQAESLISKHDPEDPLFMYLSHQAVHTGTNPGEESSLQAPKDWIEKFSSIKHPWRRRYAAMVAYLDYSVGRVSGWKKVEIFFIIEVNNLVSYFIYNNQFQVSFSPAYLIEPPTIRGRRVI